MRKKQIEDFSYSFFKSQLAKSIPTYKTIHIHKCICKITKVNSFGKNKSKKNNKKTNSGGAMRKKQKQRSLQTKQEQKNYRQRELVLLKKSELEKHNIPFSVSTLYCWHSTGKYKGIFVKVAGRLFIDVDQFWQIAAKEG